MTAVKDQIDLEKIKLNGKCKEISGTALHASAAEWSKVISIKYSRFVIILSFYIWMNNESSLILGVNRIELLTPALSTQCSNHWATRLHFLQKSNLAHLDFLSNSTFESLILKEVEVSGFEPLTESFRETRSTLKLYPPSAEVRFELTMAGLWAQRANQLLYSAKNKQTNLCFASMKILYLSLSKKRSFYFSFWRKVNHLFLKIKNKNLLIKKVWKIEKKFT